MHKALYGHKVQCWGMFRKKINCKIRGEGELYREVFSSEIPSGQNFWFEQCLILTKFLWNHSEDEMVDVNGVNSWFSPAKSTQFIQWWRHLLSDRLEGTFIRENVCVAHLMTRTGQAGREVCNGVFARWRHCWGCDRLWLKRREKSN